MNTKKGEKFAKWMTTTTLSTIFYLVIFIFLFGSFIGGMASLFILKEINTEKFILLGNLWVTFLTVMNQMLTILLISLVASLLTWLIVWIIGRRTK